MHTHTLWPIFLPLSTRSPIDAIAAFGLNPPSRTSLSLSLCWPPFSCCLYAFSLTKCLSQITQ